MSTEKIFRKSEIYTGMLKKYHGAIDSLTEIVYNSIRETIDFFRRFI